MDARVAERSLVIELPLITERKRGLTGVLKETETLLSDRHKDQAKETEASKDVH